MKIPKNRILELLCFILTLQIVGGGIGFLTAPSLDDWYNGLIKSSLTPAGWVFGVVWPLLYVMIAVAGWLLWQKKTESGAKTLLKLFALQLTMNWAWSFIFFTFHLTAIAFFWILALLGVVIILLFKLRTFCTPAFWLLMPYTLWLSFASYLSFVIWQAN